MEVYKPKSVEDAIGTLQQFLECDLYSKFRPEKEINGKAWIRDDPFKDENEFHKYIEEHFSILLKQIEKLKNDEVRDLNENG